jgi:cell wall-associated NlpC family hydrolase
MPDSVGEHTFDFHTVRSLTPVRAERDAAAEQVTQVLPGEPVVVEEERDGWARIRTAYDYPGWIRADALASGAADSAWLAPTAIDPLDHARSLLGTRYEWGGMTPAGIDCSGFVHMSFRATGRLVPRDADQQEEAGAPVPESELRPGDVITYGDEAADHVAFWVGDGRILHATGREGVDAVVEEIEPEELRRRRRRTLRLGVPGAAGF